MEGFASAVGGRKPYDELCPRQKRRVNKQVRPEIPPSIRSENIYSCEQGSRIRDGPVKIFTLSHDSICTTGGAPTTNSGASSIGISPFIRASISETVGAPTTDNFPTSSHCVFQCSRDSNDYSPNAIDDAFDSFSDEHYYSSSDESINSFGNENGAMDYEILAANEEARSFREKLACCFVENNLSHTAGDSILALLRSHQCFTGLPHSTKTLLSTPNQPVTLLDVAPGQYLHIGFVLAITRILERLAPQNIPSVLEVDISTDGAALDNSGKNQIWPLQCRAGNVDNSPTEVIGIYKGPKKPESAMDFFEPFVEEANKIIRDGGVTFLDKRISITLRSFIADAPARAFILNHMGHNSSSACSKCTVEGQSIDRRMAFRGVDHTPRTGADYSARVDEDHHKEGISPLSLLPIDMVTQVPFEYMHLVCLGVMKRLLMAWVDGKFSIETKLSAHEINLISYRLEDLINNCPREFARRPRGLSYYARYKATELRQFLLYTGPVVLEGVLKIDIYRHFLLLHASMRILASVNPSKILLVFARQALKIFVLRSETFYGASFVSYNVHGLLHIVDDVETFGPIDSYSAFPYENNMKIFRQYCRKPSHTLQQIANRRAERAQWGSSSDNIYLHNADDTPVALHRHSEGPLPANAIVPGMKQYRRVKCHRFVLDTVRRDSCCIMNNSSIGVIYNVVVCNAELYLVVRKFGSITSAFHVGIPSSSVGYYKCSLLSDELDFVRFADIRTKGYLMPQWSSHHFDERGRELLTHGEYIVVAMSCAANY